MPEKIRYTRTDMTRNTVRFKLETFNDNGKPLKKPISGEGWYINDPATKRKGLCILLPNPQKGVDQTLFISADDLRAFVKSMAR